MAPSRPITVVGGPEDLLDLADLGVVADAPVRLATDLGDGDRTTGRPHRRAAGVERNFGRIHDATSEILGAGGTPVECRDGCPTTGPPDSATWKTRSVMVANKGVTASGAEPDVVGGGGIQPADMPYSATDGYPDSVWRSARSEGPGLWWVTSAPPATARRHHHRE